MSNFEVSTLPVGGLAPIAALICSAKWMARAIYVRDGNVWICSESTSFMWCLCLNDVCESNVSILWDLDMMFHLTNVNCILVRPPPPPPPPPSPDIYHRCVIFVDFLWCFRLQHCLCKFYSFYFATSITLLKYFPLSRKKNRNNSDAEWASRRLKSPTIRLSVQTRIQTDNKNNALAYSEGI